MPGSRQSTPEAAASDPAGIPGWLFVPAGVAVGFVLFPLIGLVPNVNWPSFWELISARSAIDALWLSLRTALAATGCCLLLGVPLALVLARWRFPGRRLLRTLVLLPLVLPPVVGGISLLTAFGRRGLVGQYLEAAGIGIAFSTIAVIMAQTFVSLPFVVISLEGALRSTDNRVEQVAATLGAGPTRVFTRITLPMVGPGLASGAVLAFARSLGEFGATLTFAGSRQGVTRTLPLEIYLQREVDPDAAVALSLLLVVAAGVVVAVVYGRGSRR